METKERKYRRLTSGEIFRTMDCLTKNLVQVGTSGQYRYINDYTDTKVAELAITDPFDGDGRLAVSRIRVKEFGPLIEVNEGQAMCDRMSYLENLVAALCRELDYNPSTLLQV